MALKEKKTATELADLIQAKINLGGVRMEVHPHPVLGWTAQVAQFPAAANPDAIQAMADRAAEELRQLYDLRPDDRTGPLRHL